MPEPPNLTSGVPTHQREGSDPPLADTAAEAQSVPACLIPHFQNRLPTPLGLEAMSTN